MRGKLALLLLFLASACAAAPSLKPIICNFYLQGESQWHVRTRAGQYGIQQPIYFYNGTNASDLTGYTVVFRYGRNRGDTNPVNVASINYGTYAVATFTNGQLPQAVSSWYADVVCTSGSVYNVSCEGLITIIGTP